jgi:hypothetical protein
MDKMIGLRHHLSQKERKGEINKKSRSVCWNNRRSCELRRNADRHCHHRRRKIIREDIANTGGENIPRSTTTIQHHNYEPTYGMNMKGVARYYISNDRMCKTKW